MRPSVSTNCFCPVKKGCEFEVIPEEITEYSTPSMVSFFSEVLVDFVMKRAPVVMSTKMTGLYVGWRSFFIRFGLVATRTNARGGEDGGIRPGVKKVVGFSPAVGGGLLEL